MVEDFDAFGADFSEAAVDYVRVNLCDQVFCADALDLPYGDAFFDAIIDRCSLQHNAPSAIRRIHREVHRVLAPGGRFLSVTAKAHDGGFSRARCRRPSCAPRSGFSRASTSIT